MEARVGIEPAYTELQGVTLRYKFFLYISVLCHILTDLKHSKSGKIAH